MQRNYLHVSLVPGKQHVSIDILLCLIFTRVKELVNFPFFLLRKNPEITTCLYNIQKFDGTIIIDILKGHPKMIAGGTVGQNPFFIEPKCIGMG